MNASEDVETDRLLALFDDYAPVIKALLVRIVGDEEEAEDLLAETFAAAWEQILDPDVEPLAALVEIARERGLERIQEKGAKTAVCEDTDMELVAGSPLGNLPIMQRRVVEYVFFEGGSISRFAAEVRAPRDWVSAAVTHALSTLLENWQNGEIQLTSTPGASATQNSHHF